MKVVWGAERQRCGNQDHCSQDFGVGLRSPGGAIHMGHSAHAPTPRLSTHPVEGGE